MEVILGKLKFKGFESFVDLEKDLEFTLDQAFDLLLPIEFEGTLTVKLTYEYTDKELLSWEPGKDRL